MNYDSPEVQSRARELQRLRGRLSLSAIDGEERSTIRLRVDRLVSELNALLCNPGRRMPDAEPYDPARPELQGPEDSPDLEAVHQGRTQPQPSKPRHNPTFAERCTPDPRLEALDGVIDLTDPIVREAWRLQLLRAGYVD